jgi:hypothetical protein
VCFSPRSAFCRDEQDAAAQRQSARGARGVKLGGATYDDVFRRGRVDRLGAGSLALLGAALVVVGLGLLDCWTGDGAGPLARAGGQGRSGRSGSD